MKSLKPVYSLGPCDPRGLYLHPGLARGPDPHHRHTRLLMGAFIVFPLIGFTVNVLSLLGLVLAIGIVVDDAIIVVEAVQVNIENGMDPKTATFKAMEEVTAPVIATTLVLVAVFIPVAIMGGITGSLYQQFAITVAVSVLFSSVNALTLSPALCALLLRKKNP